MESVETSSTLPIDCENDNADTKKEKKTPRKRPRTKAIRIELKNRVSYFNTFCVYLRT